MELWRKKNTDTRITFPIVDADGDSVTGAADLDSEYASYSTSDHGGAAPSFTDMTHEATEIGATGIYYLDVQGGEINADFTHIQVKTSTAGAKTQHILIRTMVADPLHIATTDDDAAIDASALNTLASHDPGEAIMGATDLGTGAGLTTLATAAALAVVDGITDKLDSAMELDGAVYRFTANALEQAPGGGGVGSDANIVSIAGVPVNTATAQLGVNVVSVATNAIAADSLAADAATEVADAVLLRGVENVEASATAHTLATAILHSTGRTRRNLQTLETYRSDGTTLHMTQALTPDPAGQPVSEIGDGTTV